MKGLVRLLRGNQPSGMPGIVNAQELIPLVEGLGIHLISQTGWNRCNISLSHSLGDDTAAHLHVSSLAIRFYSLYLSGRWSCAGACWLE